MGLSARWVLHGVRGLPVCIGHAPGAEPYTPVFSSYRIAPLSHIGCFPLLQEMASRGVSLVYRLGDAAVRDKLVGALVGVLQGGGAAGGGAGRPVKLTGDTQVGAVFTCHAAVRFPGNGDCLAWLTLAANVLACKGTYAPCPHAILCAEWPQCDLAVRLCPRHLQSLRHKPWRMQDRLY